MGIEPRVATLMFKVFRILAYLCVLAVVLLTVWSVSIGYWLTILYAVLLAIFPIGIIHICNTMIEMNRPYLTKEDSKS